MVIIEDMSSVNPILSLGLDQLMERAAVEPMDLVREAGISTRTAYELSKRDTAPRAVTNYVQISKVLAKHLQAAGDRVEWYEILEQLS